MANSRGNIERLQRARLHSTPVPPTRRPQPATATWPMKPVLRWRTYHPWVSRHSIVSWRGKRRTPLACQLAKRVSASSEYKVVNTAPLRTDGARTRGVTCVIFDTVEWWQFDLARIKEGKFHSVCYARACPEVSEILATDTTTLTSAVLDSNHLVRSVMITRREPWRGLVSIYLNQCCALSAIKKYFFKSI